MTRASPPVLTSPPGSIRGSVPPTEGGPRATGLVGSYADTKNRSQAVGLVSGSWLTPWLAFLDQKVFHP